MPHAARQTERLRIAAALVAVLAVVALWLLGVQVAVGGVLAVGICALVAWIALAPRRVHVRVPIEEVKADADTDNVGGNSEVLAQELSFLSAIEALARSIGSETEMDAFLADVCEAACTHCGAEDTALICPGPAMRIQVVPNQKLLEPDGAIPPSLRDLVRRVIRAGSPIILSRSEAHDLFEPWEGARQAGLTSAAAVPVRTSRKVAGVLLGLSKGRRPLAHEGLSRMEHLAIFAGSALNTVALVDELQRKNSELQETVGQLQVAERAREEFFRFLIHDLNKPLAAIIGTANRLAGQQEMPETLVPRVERVSAAATRLRDIVARLLEYERIRRGELSRDPMPVDLMAIISETTSLLAEKSEAEVLLNGVPLDSTRPREPRTVVVDELQISRIIQNLTDNALRFCDRLVTIDVTQVDRSMVVTFWNDGPPIAPEDRERVFDEFYRRTSAGDGRGYGIGLASARFLAEGAGGRIWVEPVEAGAMFKVSLPLMKTPTARSEKS